MQNNNIWEIKNKWAKDRIILLWLASFFVMVILKTIEWSYCILNDILKNSYHAWIIIGIIILICLFFIIRKIRKRIRLDNAIKSGIVRRKQVKVIGFEWIKNDNNQHCGDYYIVFSDWENKYNSITYTLPEIVWKTDECLKNDEFFIKKWIILDLQNREITKKQLEQKISELESQKTEENSSKNSSLDSEILEYKNKINDLEPYHLHTKDRDFYIWDSDIVLIDPEDQNNYILESENKMNY